MVSPTVNGYSHRQRKFGSIKFFFGTLLLIAILISGLAFRFSLSLTDTSSSFINDVPSGKLRKQNQLHSQSPNKNDNEWCENIEQARSALNPSLRIAVTSCESLLPAKSAIVVYITAGVSPEMTSRVVFSAQDYINGVLALGSSLLDHLASDNVHKLLLLQQAFLDSLSPELLGKLKKYWTIGIAPKVNIDAKYLPRFKRYRSVYSKLSILGLAEYECV